MGLDQPMPFKGSLKATPLADLLRQISHAGLTGTLVFQVGWNQKKLYFRNGRLISAGSTHPREFIGQYLLRHGWITEEQLIDALEEQIRTGKLIGRLLIEKGWLTPDQLRMVLQEKAHETIYSLFLNDEATFTFHPDELPTYDMVPIMSTLDKLLREGVSRKDTWERIQRSLPARTRTVLRRKANLQRVPDTETSPLALQLLTEIDGKRTLGEITLLLRQTDYAVLKAAAELLQAGWVEVAGEVEREPHRPGDVSLEVMIEACRFKLKEKHLDGAHYLLTLIEHAYSRLLNEILQLHREFRELIREQTLPHISPDAIPVLNKPLEELTDLQLAPLQGYLLARINGTYDVKTLQKLVPMEEQQFYLILKQLRDMDLIRFQRPRKT